MEEYLCGSLTPTILARRVAEHPLFVGELAVEQEGIVTFEGWFCHELLLELGII